jgi:hypothetical protein
MTTQLDILVNHFTQGKSLTSLEAMGVYRIFRLASRVSELRQQGYDIVTDMKRDETGKTYASYRYANDADFSLYDLKAEEESGYTRLHDSVYAT